MTPTIQQKITQIENIIIADNRRNTQAFRPHTKGALLEAVSSIASTPNAKIGIATGFVVADKNGAMTLENDGPCGAILLAKSLQNGGFETSVMIEQRHAPTLLPLCELAQVPLRALGENIPKEIARLEQEKYTHIISIERIGKAKDDHCYSMKGKNLLPWHTLIDDIFEAKNGFYTIAIGDGGNEIGMGNIPHSLVCEHIPNGDKIHCQTRVDALILATVSNFGSFALIKALSILRQDLSDKLLAYLHIPYEKKLLQMGIDCGIVEGISGEPTIVVDDMPIDEYNAIIEAVLGV